MTLAAVWAGPISHHAQHNKGRFLMRTNTTTSQRTAIQLGGFVPFSASDYPNHLVCVAFIQGCNWRCGYCHNRSEEHTSELQSRGHLVCRLLLEKKKRSQVVRTR